MYDKVCPALYAPELENMPTSRGSHHFMVFGWSETVNEADTETRGNITRRDFGMPGQEPVCQLQITTRLCFKSAFIQCQAMEETARATALP